MPPDTRLPDDSEQESVASMSDTKQPENEGDNRMDLKTARRLLANQSKEELLRIIVSLSGLSEEADDWLLDYCEDYGEAGDAEFLARKQVEHCWSIAESILKEANYYGDDDEYDVSEGADIGNEGSARPIEGVTDDEWL